LSDEQYYKKKTLKYQQKIEQLLKTQNAGVEGTIRRLEILGGATGNTLFIANNVTYDEFSKLNVDGKVLFKKHELLRSFTYACHIDMGKVFVFNDKIQINYNNLRVEFEKMIDNDITLTIVYTPTTFQAEVYNRNNRNNRNNHNRRFIINIPEPSNYHYNSTGENLYKSIEKLIDTPNFNVYFDNEDGRKLLKREDVLSQCLFVTPYAYYPIYVEIM